MAVDESDLDPDLKRSRRLLELFLTQVSRAVGDLDVAEAAGKLREMQPELHKLKGACLIIGARRMADAVAHLERAVLLSNETSKRVQVDEMKSAFARLRLLLEAELRDYLARDDE